MADSKAAVLAAVEAVLQGETFQQGRVQVRVAQTLPADTTIMIDQQDEAYGELPQGHPGA